MLISTCRVLLTILEAGAFLFCAPISIRRIILAGLASIFLSASLNAAELWEEDFMVLRRLMAAPIQSQIDVNRIANLYDAIATGYEGKLNSAGEISIAEIAAKFEDHPNVGENGDRYIFVPNKGITVQPDKVIVQVVNGSMTSKATAEYVKAFRNWAAADPGFLLVDDEKLLRLVITLHVVDSSASTALYCETTINPAGSELGIRLRGSLTVLPNGNAKEKMIALQGTYKDCLVNRLLPEKFLMLKKLAPAGDFNQVAAATTTTQRIYKKYVEK